MKIVILCTQLEAGGAQRAAIRLCEEFRIIGLESENWFLYKKREIFLETPNLKLMLPRSINSKTDYILATYKFYKNIKKYKPDVLITFTHYSNIVGQFIAWLNGTKIRIASHRNISDKDMSKKLMFLDNINAITGIYKDITAVSESTKKSFNYYPIYIYNNIKVIHNGLNFLPSQLTKEDCRKKLNLPCGVKLLGNVGRLSLQKNHITILKAIMSLEDIHFAVVGEGELRNDLEKYISDNNLQSRIYLLGEIPSSIIPDFLKAIDVFVMPSLYEGLSNALVEALKAGLPILASDVESQRDVIEFTDGSLSGMLLPATDVEDWKNEIQNLFINSDAQAELSKKAITRGNDFSMKNMVNGFVELMNQ